LAEKKREASLKGVDPLRKRALRCFVKKVRAYEAKIGFIFLKKEGGHLMRRDNARKERARI